MNSNVKRTADALLSAHNALCGMSGAERSTVAEAVIAELRKQDLLKKSTFNNYAHRKSFEVETDVLSLRIAVLFGEDLVAATGLPF